MSGGHICAIASCKSNQLTLKKKGLSVIFHSFPKGKDLVSSTMRSEWVQRCKRADKFNPDTSLVCAFHFTENDYERDLRNELLGLPVRRILKKTAVPTVSLHQDECQTEETPYEKVMTKKKNKEIVDSLLATTCSEDLISKQSSEDSARILSPPEDITTMLSSFYTEITESSESAESYKKKYIDLLQRYNQLKASSSKKIKGLNTMLKYYKNKCYNQSTNQSRKSK